MHYSLILGTTEAGNLLVTGNAIHMSGALSIIFFVLSHASGLWNVPWQQGELFGLEGAYTVLFLCPSLISRALRGFFLYFFRYPHSRVFFPVHGIGTSLATATDWSASLIIINSTYLSLMGQITPLGACGFYAGLWPL